MTFSQNHHINSSRRQHCSYLLFLLFNKKHRLDRYCRYVYICVCKRLINYCLLSFQHQRPSASSAEWMFFNNCQAGIGLLPLVRQLHVSSYLQRDSQWHSLTAEMHGLTTAKGHKDTPALPGRELERMEKVGRGQKVGIEGNGGRRRKRDC